MHQIWSKFWRSMCWTYLYSWWLHSSGSAKCRYLGVYFTSGRSFRCSYDSAKSSFFRAFNAIYSKVWRTASEETVIALLRSKCLPVLLYATEACPLLMRDQRSLEFTVTRVFMKIFRTGSSAVITECQRNFNFLSIQRQLLIRTAKFLQAFAASENHICPLLNSECKSSVEYYIVFSISYFNRTTYKCNVWSIVLHAMSVTHI